MKKLEDHGVNFRTKHHPSEDSRPDIKEDLKAEIPYQMYYAKVTIGISSTALFENNSVNSYSLANLYPNKNSLIQFHNTAGNYKTHRVEILNEEDAFQIIMSSI